MICIWMKKKKKKKKKKHEKNAVLSHKSHVKKYYFHLQINQ